MVLAVGLGVYIYNYFHEQREVEASAALFDLDKLPESRGKQTYPGSAELLKVVENYSGTQAAERALLMAAEAYFREQKYDDARAKFDRFYGATVPPKKGWHLSGMFDAMERGDLKALYVIGENPLQSEADQHRATRLLEGLDFLVVQDIFLTETAYLADVILPASAFPEKDGTFTNTDRLVQMGRKAVEPPGDARQDLWIIQQMAQRLGLDWNYNHVSEVFDEMRHTMPSIGGITWDRLQHEHAVTYPCRAEGDPGESVVFVDHFPREGAGPRSEFDNPARRVHRDMADHRTRQGARVHARRRHLPDPVPARRREGNDRCVLGLDSLTTYS